MKKSLIVFSTLIITFTFTAFGYYNWNEVPCDTSQANVKISSIDGIALKNDFREVVRKTSGVPDFYYIVGPRFNVISRENLCAAKSIIDILPLEEIQDKADYEYVVVSIVNEDGSRRDEYGDNEVLNSKQLELLRSADYSTDLFISTYCQKTDAESGEKEEYQIRYYLTVVPEQEAVFKEGNEALIHYLP